MIDPHQYCKEKTIKSGSSFYYSFMFLPKEKQKAICAIYAFCREVDDIVDDCSDKDVARTKLKWWEEQVNAIYDGTPEHPVALAIQSLLPEFNLPKTILLEIIQGMNMDLQYQGYKTFDDLKLYCHCVASTVGILSAEIFGYQYQKTLEFARNLGIAFQLVNIIRDVGEDASRGRIYIPEEDLSLFDITPKQILDKKIINRTKFIRLMEYEVNRAKSFYQKALVALPDKDRKNQKPGLIMARIYFKLLDKIIQKDFPVLDTRVRLMPITKLWTAWSANRFENKIYGKL